jgi:putative hemolysin
MAPRRAAIANPASVNCIDRGGTLTIVRKASGGEYGICTFAGGRQCEEWALWRGDCPPGGVDITGSDDAAARYCLITGGVYSTKMQDDEQSRKSLCTLRDKTPCDAQEYYTGKCP